MIRTIPKKLEKIPTYITGLDEILKGGLPRSRTTLVAGAPGSGKTILSPEFLYRGAISGEGGIFLGFEETAKHIRQNAISLGWDLAGMEKSDKLFLLEGQISPETVVSGKFNLKPILSIISHKAREMRATRLVIDTLDVLLSLLESPLTVRSELHYLNRWLTKQGLTTILTMKPQNGQLRQQDFFYYMAD